MIYLISNQIRLDTEDIQTATVQDCLDYFSDKEIIGLDIETEGFDPYTKKMLSLQLGDYDNQFVIDTLTIDVTKLSSLLEDKSKLFLGHNLKFDLNFLLHKKIIINNVYDTYISEQIIHNGYDYIKKGLAAVVERYCNIYLDKSVRDNIYRYGLSTEVIIYGARDVQYLETIMQKQIEEATKKSVLGAIKLNNLFVPVMAYLEYCGFKLDTKLWQEKIDIDTKQIQEIENELNSYILNNNISKFIDNQLDLFSSEVKVRINWASSPQVVEFFQLIGVDTSTIDKDTGESKQSASADVLKKQIDVNPIVGKYIRYRELLKRVSTYGTNWFKFINPVTERIHTKYQQWMNTGRMSSGGKDKNTKIDYPKALGAI